MSAENAQPFLENWYRRHLRSAKFDLSSSGVQAYNFREVRRLTGLSSDELDAIWMEDSLTLGADALRNAIAARYAHGDASRVLVTHGSSEAIFLGLGALLRRGQRVLALTPIYHSLLSCAQLAGCEVRPLPLALVRQGKRDWNELIPEGTSVVIVNFPHNPTGYSPSPERLSALRRRCAEIGAWLVWDAAFEELPLENHKVQLEFETGERIMRFGTFSKAFGLPGLRVGWCIAPAEILERTLAVRDRTTLFLSPLIEAIATRVVCFAERFIRPRLQLARENLQIVERWLAENDTHSSWDRPSGGVCGLVRLRDIGDTETFCLQLLAQTGVLLVPGKAFSEPQTVRLGFGGDRASLETGLAHIASALRQI